MDVRKITKEQLMRMNADELYEYSKEAYRASKSRINRLNKMGLEIGQYNENFLDQINTKELKEAYNTDRNAIYSRAAYIYRHLNADKNETTNYSSVRGLNKKMRKSLQRLEKVMHLYGNEFSFKQGDKSGEFIITELDEYGEPMETKVTSKELSEFWKEARKLQDEQNIANLKSYDTGKSNVSTIFYLYFHKGMKSYRQMFKEAEEMNLNKDRLETAMWNKRNKKKVTIESGNPYASRPVKVEHIPLNKMAKTPFDDEMDTD